MSTTTTSEEKKEEVTPTTPVTTVPVSNKDSGFLGLGIDLNNPFYALGALVAGAAVGLAGLSIYNRFVVPRLAPIPPEKPPVAPPVVTVPTPDELRMKERAAGVENRRKTAEEEYIESIRLNGLVEQQQNRNLQRHNIHQSSNNFYDQMYDVAPPVKHPLTFPRVDDEDEVTEVFDDFAPEYRDYRPAQLQQQQQQQQQQEKPLKMRAAAVDRQPPPPPKPVEETQAVSPEEIDSYDHVDIRKIPAEFVNVGNRPEPFENIQQVEQQNTEEDPYDIGDMEIDADTLKVLETNAVAASMATAGGGNAPPQQANNKNSRK